MTTRTILRTLAIAAVLALGATRAVGAVTLDDPVGYRVKHTWSAATLGIPGNLGTLIFSADGTTLYVVGASESPVSALYAVPVVRDPVTNEVVDFGPAASVTKVFSGNAQKPGLDAGFDVGPGGTLFYTYWPSNRMGERPEGFGGAETIFDMGLVGVPSSIAGLAFSPHLQDPATGFGQLQVSSWSGANLYDVPLTPAGNGIFTPGTARLFVTLPKEGTGAIQYIPSGPQAGNLMYVNYSYGEVRVLSVDAATGLPIDKTTGLPTRGTTTPKDERFVSGIGGPWGLEFDGRTNDFFVGTWGGDPANSIIQIGGFPKTEKCDNGLDDDDDGLVDCDDPSCAASCPAPTGAPTPVATASAEPTVGPTAQPTAVPTPAGTDDFSCYKAPRAPGAPPAPPATVRLADALGAATIVVGKPRTLCAPAAVDGAAVADATANLRCYALKAAKHVCANDAAANAGRACAAEEDCGGRASVTSLCVAQPKFAKRTVRVAHALGVETVTVAKPQLYCVPSEVDGTPSDLGIDHFECYKAKTATGTPKVGVRTLRLADRFDDVAVTVAKPQLYCAAVSREGAPITDPAARLRCFEAMLAKKTCTADAPLHAGRVCKQEQDCGGEKSITRFCVKQPKLARVAVGVANELGLETATVVKRELVCGRAEELP